MRQIAALALALLVASALFFMAPQLDLATVHLFYDGTRFPIAGNRQVEVLRVMLYAAEDIGFLATVAMIYLARHQRVLGLSARDWLFQMLVFAIGPGLIVNGILKRFWGRARPYNLTEFGGDAAFSRAWQFSDQCAGNCSFVSGEMAGATALAIGLTMTLRANRWRLGEPSYHLGLTLACAIPLATAWQRMASGRHFLSDVVIAALLVGLEAAVLRQALWAGRDVNRC